jgi:hypothetical protein
MAGEDDQLDRLLRRYRHLPMAGRVLVSADRSRKKVSQGLALRHRKGLVSQGSIVGIECPAHEGRPKIVWPEFAGVPNGHLDIAKGLEYGGVVLPSEEGRIGRSRDVRMQEVAR